MLTLVAVLPDALMALWLSLLGAGVIDHNRTLVILAALALGLSATATWFLTTISTRVQRRFRDRVTIMLEAHVARLQASVSTIAHQERPDYLDRLAVLRDQVFVLDHMYMSLFSTCGWILRLGVTIVLLMAISPLLILLAVFALPTVFASAWRPGVERAVQESVAPFNRLARHLFTTATTAAPGKEVRMLRIGGLIASRRREEWERWYAPMARARWATAGWNSVAWLVFGLGYAGAVVYVASGLHAPTAKVLLVLAAGSRLSSYIGATVGEIGFLRGTWLDGSRRLAWFEDYASAVALTADLPVPERLHDGIRFEHVSFRYPGTDRLVLNDVNLHLRPGSVVAIVGENGAGKTTLVKLLARLYDPVDGRDPDRRHGPITSGRRRLARPSVRRLSGLLPLRASRPAVGGSGRRAARRRRAGGGRRRGTGRRRGRRRPAGIWAGHPARPDMAPGRRRFVRPMAEAGPIPGLHAGPAAALRPRRADGGPRRRDRARVVRALRGCRRAE